MEFEIAESKGASLGGLFFSNNRLVFRRNGGRWANDATYYFRPTWSPDLKLIAFDDNKMEVWVSCRFKGGR
jgi:hypothetical protein